jgi:hypothetical protein
MRSCCVVGATIVEGVMYSRAFFIRAIARVKYPRVYSRHHNDLRVMSTSSKTRRAVLHWKRVAKSGRDCFQSSGTAPQAPSAAADTQFVSALFPSPSLFSMAGFVVAVATRQPRFPGSALRIARSEPIGARRRMRVAPTDPSLARRASMRSSLPALIPARALTCTYLHEVV